MVTRGSKLRPTPALLLTTFLLSCLVVESRVFQPRRALLDVADCAERKSGQTYKPKGGGKFKRKYEDQRDEGRCVDKCKDDYDVAVYNTRSESCYCWEASDGQWETDRSGDDKAYYVWDCRFENCGMGGYNDDDCDPNDDDADQPRGYDDELDAEKERRNNEDDDSSDERSNDDGRKEGNNNDDSDKSEETPERSEKPDRSEEPDSSDSRDKPRSNGSVDNRQRSQSQGPGSYTPPSCVKIETFASFQPIPGIRPRPYNSLTECFTQCLSIFDVITWRAAEERCYCYTNLVDGWWDTRGNIRGSRDVSYDLEPCDPSSQRASQLPGGQIPGGQVPYYGGQVPGGWNPAWNPYYGGQVPGVQNQVPMNGIPGQFPGMMYNQGQLPSNGMQGQVPGGMYNQGQVAGSGVQGQNTGMLYYQNQLLGNGVQGQTAGMLFNQNQGNGMQGQNPGGMMYQNQGNGLRGQNSGNMFHQGNGMQGQAAGGMDTQNQVPGILLRG